MLYKNLKVEGLRAYSVLIRNYKNIYSACLGIIFKVIELRHAAADTYISNICIISKKLRLKCTSIFDFSTQT